MNADAGHAYQYGDVLELSGHPGWAREFREGLVPLKDRVARHPLFQEMGAGELALEDCYHPVLAR